MADQAPRSTWASRPHIAPIGSLLLDSPFWVASEPGAASRFRIEARLEGPHAPPVLAVIDLKLPRRSGLELLEWIRSRPDLRKLPVVVLTSSRQREDIDRYELRANPYLLKPVDFDDLLRIVRLMSDRLGINEYPRVDGVPR